MMKKPNIIFFFSDQQRADTIGAYGQKLNITPNLDRLAEEGVVFEQAYSAQPVCGPCRALFQTGRYPTEINCFRNNQALPLDIKHWRIISTKHGMIVPMLGNGIWQVMENWNPNLS